MIVNKKIDIVKKITLQQPMNCQSKHKDHYLRMRWNLL